ncbi:hypothetical protein NC652_018127 [Populus alba x Populus x berolinensis]|uniref:Uncharacterized protein n=1 Tax=Populus alba x Populus x berolinensis TaxID=444605 RepID=A0AAD6QRK3_9ROSI|nr:hypothetical protein NC652_018127 [Populus alba x Populus x berolinensis]KAJ6995346.1 hypothetical protein NC653_017966 [Populus alba x Populus x berolinensis]
MAPGSKEGAKRTERRRNLEKVGPSKGDRHQLKVGFFIGSWKRIKKLQLA